MSVRDLASKRARLLKTAYGRALLWSLSLAYGAAVVARRWLFDIGLLKSFELPAKVVCIGNITTGGTGKTPAVLLAAQTLRRRNHSVAILSRGYGRGAASREVVALLDDKAPHWTVCGDEPWMMHQALHGLNVPILVSPDRTKAGREAVTFYHSRVVILDDGFQHMRLRRDLDIVLLNAADPFGGDALLPLGNLREPVGTLARAGLVVLTHADLVDEARLEEVRKRVREVNAKAPILEAAHKADFLLDLRSEKKLKLSALEGRKVAALSGLGDPASFEAQLERIGSVVEQKWRYPDHHAYRLKELRAIEKLKGARPLVTTFKDIARLPKGWREELSGEVYALGIKLDITKGRNVWIDSLLSLASDSGAGEPAADLEEAE